LLHAETIKALLEPVGFSNQVGLLIGSLNAKDKQHIRKSSSQGKIRLLIGTHALIQDDLDVHCLGLVIVDEQHRFGVQQRKKLQAKAGYMPHVLNMTATPIPRSLALTLYGELDISLIDEMPTKRSMTKTQIIPPSSRERVLKGLDEKIQRGEQVFVVCPLITDSESLKIRSVEEVFEQLSKGIFKHRRMGLLHGKMKTLQKEEVMTRFKSHELDILVCTTVIEVGVHVPNASVMIIESAERFGLAQLHQLRGRVGRAGQEGTCYLMLDDSSPPSRRLRALETVSDGFKLAELDLGIRGPGAIYGSSQHGLLDLRVAKLSDTKLIASARAAAQEFLDRQENLLNYKQLAERVNKLRAVTNLN
jgi:ATP-dependent DNA helicase RecG